MTSLSSFARSTGIQGLALPNGLAMHVCADIEQELVNTRLPPSRVHDFQPKVSQVRERLVEGAGILLPPRQRLQQPRRAHQRRGLPNITVPKPVWPLCLGLCVCHFAISRPDEEKEGRVEEERRLPEMRLSESMRERTRRQCAATAGKSSRLIGGAVEDAAQESDPLGMHRLRDVGEEANMPDR